MNACAWPPSTPARFLGLDGELGHVAPDFRADLVLFDEDFRVADTWVAGAHQSH